MNNIGHLTVAFAVLVLAVGCETRAPRTGTLDRIEAALNQGISTAPAASGVPVDVSDALLPTIELNVPKLPEVQDSQRFDISVSNVPADQFFMSLVEGTNFNMVVHPEVTGTISLNLKNVSVPEVMEAARDVYGFEFGQTTYGFQVLPSRLGARIFEINYLNISRTGNSSTFVSSGTLQEGPGASRLSSPDDGRGYPTSTSSRRGQRTIVGTQINTHQPETSFWQELQTAVTAIVGGGQGRSVVVNPQAGVVVVRAIPNELREVEAFLRATQLIAQRQVILEAKILEVELSDGFQTGVNWGALAGDFTLAQTGGGSNLVGQSGLSDIAGQSGNLNPDPNLFSPISGALASAFGGVFSFAFAGNHFASFIELLEDQGNVQVLSSPRISTMNNQKAIIKVGTDEFFVTDISTTTVTGTATTSTPNIELTPFFSGIALDVTPQISGSGEVTLHMHPTVSNVVDQQKTITISGITQTLPLARSTVRESDTIVRAKSGQIVVIGGLMQERTDDRDAKTPGLGDAPVFGNLFKQQRATTIKSELVILLRPIVVDGPQRWADALTESQKHFSRLRDELHQWEAQRVLRK